jgi:hypothetical protein
LGKNDSNDKIGTRLFHGVVQTSPPHPHHLTQNSMTKKIYTLATSLLIILLGTSTAFAQTAVSQGKVHITASSLTIEGYQQIQAYYYNLNGSTEDSIALNLNVKNTGTRTFDPLEPDPLNPGEIHQNRQWGGAVNCGTLVNPVSSEYEGQVLLPKLAPNSSKAAKAYIYKASSAITKIQNGEVLPCHIIPLHAYSNIQPDLEMQVYFFDLYYNGTNDKIEIANFRQENKKRNSNLQNIETGKRTTPNTPITSKTVPPAGYEDEVITNYQNYSNPFPDTNIAALEGKAASELYRRAVIGGFPDGEFKGDRPVNRAEAAKFLLLAKGITVGDKQNNGRFWDAVEGEWYVKYMIEAADRNIISGHPDGSFRPGDGVQRDQFLKMLNRTFELPEYMSANYGDVTSSAWSFPFVGAAIRYNLFPNEKGSNKLQPGKKMTREEVAIAIYQYLADPMRDVPGPLMPPDGQQDPGPPITEDEMAKIIQKISTYCETYNMPNCSPEKSLSVIDSDNKYAVIKVGGFNYLLAKKGSEWSVSIASQENNICYTGSNSSDLVEYCNR